MLPDHDEVAAGHVMAVPEEVRRVVLGLGQDSGMPMAQYIVWVGRPALDNAITQARRPLGKDLPHVQLVPGHKADAAVTAGVILPPL